MTTKERGFMATILIVIFSMVTLDLITDSNEGVRWWHLLSEGSIAAATLFGLFYLIRDSFNLKHSLADEKKRSDKLQAEAEMWQMQSKKYLQGLSESIDEQLSKWHLSVAEKEVAFLLLKGLSLKEIAEIRSTSEKTTRTQSIAIYSKAGLGGRSELSAFFLEDLLLPTNSKNN